MKKRDQGSAPQLGDRVLFVIIAADTKKTEAYLEILSNLCNATFIVYSE